MTEKPILFSGAMVRAIFAGKKTQTRRLIKPQPEHGVSWIEEGGVQKEWLLRDETGDDVDEPLRCPYGQPGDRLWVKETWSIESHGGHSVGGVGEWNYAVTYRADGAERAFRHRGDCDSDPYVKSYDSRRGDWTPSIHMPRWASRLTLEVTSVRVERLQDITEADILAEGITVDLVAQWCNVPWSSLPTLHDAWRVLWDSINGERAIWASNPFCWVIGFRRVS